MDKKKIDNKKKIKNNRIARITRIGNRIKKDQKCSQYRVIDDRALEIKGIL
jgi:hypothetical protein